MNKDTEYNKEKHRQLNSFAQTMRIKAHDAQLKEYDIITEEIKSLEKTIKKARFVFIIIFAFGMFAGIISTTVLLFLNPSEVANDSIPSITSGAAFAPELALYQTITNPMQKKIDDLDKRRRDISMNWIKSIDNISRHLGDENKMLTKHLVGIDNKEVNNV